jgi:8-oxo-dGTP pyrophosphatase MutT (NUDIX family)
MILKRFRQPIADLLRRSPFIMAAGHTVIRFFQPKFSVGVVAVVVNSAGEILLVEHVFHPTAPWGLPGGWIHRSEQPGHCVQREIREELGLEVRVSALLAAEVSLPNHLDFAFLCEPVGEIGQLSFELLGYAWHAPEKLPHLLTFHRFAVDRYIQNHLMRTPVQPV